MPPAGGAGGQFFGMAGRRPAPTYIQKGFVVAVLEVAQYVPENLTPH
jgi:hypothetical protein